MQSVAPEANPLAGQVDVPPGQVSATSHCPAEARQVLPDVNAHDPEQQAVDVPFTPVPRSHASRPKFVSTVESPQVEA